MGDVRISARPTKSANAESLFLMVGSQIIDLSSDEVETELPPGQHTVSAILTRKDGECGPVTCEVTLSTEENAIIDSLCVEVVDWGDINQVKKTITIA